MEKFEIGQIVKVKLTDENVMIVSKICYTLSTGYLVRLSNYAEIVFKDFELEGLKNE